MNEILIAALANRIKAGQMTIEQVPIPLRESVQVKVESVQDGQEEAEE